MSNRLPEIGQWYRHLDKGQLFFVVATDVDDMSVEVQHFDGDTEEYSFEEWRVLPVEPAAEPESWAGAMDVAEPDDLGTEITDTRSPDWVEPQEEFRAVDAANSADDFAEGYISAEPLEAAEQAAAALHAGSERLIGADNGVVREHFSSVWYAEYSEDLDSGLWQAELFKHDVPEWREPGLASLSEAREAARAYYDQL